MKSVCIDARLIHAPGIGTYLKNLLTQFRSAPWKWYALVGPEHVRLLSQWDYLEPIIVTSGIYTLKEQLELPIKIPRVDLFWSPHFNVPCGPIRACKRLTTVHDVFHLAHASQLGFFERMASRILMRAAARLSDHLITVSNFSKDEIEKHLHVRCPITVIYHGIDSIFSEKGDLSVMEKYGIEGSFLLYVGSFKEHKNIKGLIEAFSMLSEWQDVKLVIAGGGQGMRRAEDVKQLCIAHPALTEKIYCVGQVLDEELPCFYQHAAAFVFPSFYEGFGLPPLEAMRAGCPTIVARSGAVPEVCGDGAIYVDPYAPRQIAEKIAELLRVDEKRKALSKKGMERAQRFCWKRSAEMHCSVIEGLMG